MKKYRVFIAVAVMLVVCMVPCLAHATGEPINSAPCYTSGGTPTPYSFNDLLSDVWYGITYVGTLFTTSGIR